MNRHRVLVCVLSLTVAVVSAQSRPTFEVASVKKRNEPLQGFPDTMMANGTIRMSSTTVLQLVSTAYNVSQLQIVGAPAWTKTDLYDVAAKLPKNCPAIRCARC
jgi:uncharacterized protein (TIGR03435 family)